ncbi:hypothetical protein VW23_009930 [Devosia insulae DS-56]|uniref:Uncharacterized protein n=1 Tax=Devosia insulae DS-56 TaxID=1116389 RepID=A0A1E5XVY3_9HYPH|nr:hypothetical protein [Devosia insulae]OEO32756.1 hypothetical protein VW23_009930 [Devosia insulae DS-56]
MTTFLSSAALGWFLRRILDWGGWLGAALLAMINFYNALPPQLQVAIAKIVAGNWREITLGAVPGLVALVWSQIQSFRATVRPQVVIDGQQLPIKKMPHREATGIEELSRTALEKRGKTLFEKLLKLKLGRP